MCTETPTDQPKALGRSYEIGLLLAAAAVLLAPIWTVRYRLPVDYANHLASALVSTAIR